MRHSYESPLAWTFGAVVTLALTMLANYANAEDINFNMYGDNPETGLVGPAGGLGETWNQSDAVSASGLLDSTGAATSVGYTTVNMHGPWNWGNPSLRLIQGGRANFDTSTDNTQQFVINGLTPGDLYNVWIASANTLSTQRSSGEWSTPNNTISAKAQTCDNTANIIVDSWVAGNNYVFFQDVEADANGEIVFNGHSNHKSVVGFDPRLPLSGFQLRPGNQVAGPVDAGVSTVEASPDAVSADGSSVSTITVTLKDATGLAVEGKEVTLANTSGPQMAVIDPQTAQTTGPSGTVTFAVSSSTPGVEVFTATDVTDGNLAITQSASVEFMQVVGPVDADLSTVVALPTGVLADGSSISTITVTLKDATGLAVEGKEVTLANTAGPQMAVIDPQTAQTTDANGKGSFTVTSSTVGAEVFTATDTTDGDLVITETATVNFVNLTTPLTINLNFDTELRTGLEGPAGGLDETWNQPRALAASNLLTADGVGTSVAMMNSCDGIDPWGGTLSMLIGGARSFGWDVPRTMEIVGLTSGRKYDLYIASFYINEQGSKGIFTTGNVTSNGQTQYNDNGGPAGNSSTWVQGENYVLFEDVEPDESNKITIGADGVDGKRAIWSGFQLVEVPTSAPGFVLILR